METNDTAEKRTIVQREKKGLQIRDILLIGILLASGAVLKFFVGTVINIGMKPNFIISMYCLAILLIKPRLYEAAIIGVIAGAVCQFFPGQPYINLVSELTGAIAVCLLARIPLEKVQISAKAQFLEKVKIPVKNILCAFLGTLVSGFTFIGIMYLLYYTRSGILVSAPTPLVAFMAIIFGTATINAVIVQVLYIPLKLALKK
jgi:hypothetical protein